MNSINRLSSPGGTEASGKRSAASAQVETKVGFHRVFNMLEGPERDRDAQNQRAYGGRHQSLPPT